MAREYGNDGKGKPAEVDYVSARVPVQALISNMISEYGRPTYYRVMLVDRLGDQIDAKKFQSRKAAENQLRQWQAIYPTIDTAQTIDQAYVIAPTSSVQDPAYTESSTVQDPYMPPGLFKKNPLDGVVDDSLKLQSTDSGRVGTVKKEDDDLADEMWGQRLAMIPTDE